MRTIGIILFIIGTFIINQTVGFNIIIMIGGSFLIVGIWLYAWKTFLISYDIDLDGNKNDDNYYIKL